jgi:hypothetical protein
MSFETFMTSLRSLVEVDLGLRAWFNDKRTVVVGADALAVQQVSRERGKLLAELNVLSSCDMVESYQVLL